MALNFLLNTNGCLYTKYILGLAARQSITHNVHFSVNYLTNNDMKKLSLYLADANSLRANNPEKI